MIPTKPWLLYFGSPKIKGESPQNGSVVVIFSWIIPLSSVPSTLFESFSFTWTTALPFASVYEIMVTESALLILIECGFTSVNLFGASKPSISLLYIFLK